MYKLITSKDVFDRYLETLHVFLEDCGFTEDGVLQINKRDLHKILKGHCKVIFEDYKNFVIVNNIKWNHQYDGKLKLWVVTDTLEVFLKTKPNYIKRKIEGDIPSILWDLDDPNLSGELKEEMIKMFTQRQP